MIKCSMMKIPIRAAQNKQRGRQFDMPELKVENHCSRVLCII